MKLLGVHLSPFVRKVAVIATAKGLGYEHEVVMPGDESPEFRKMSPLGKIPVLVDGDLALPDSSVIGEYLEEKYPDSPMLPNDIKQRAQARFLEEYADSKLVEATSPIFVENFVNPNIFQQPTDAERAKQAENELLPPLLDYLETRAPAEGLMFGAFTTADISIASPLYNAAYGGYALDAARWPKLAAYLQRVDEHPAVAQVRAVEKQALSQMMQS